MSAGDNSPVTPADPDPTGEASRTEASAESDGNDVPVRPQTRAERLALLREAAIQAEYATGAREETDEQARRGVIRRVGTIVVGFIVLIGGIIMMALPGPGILTVIAGLAILAQELAWAERLLEYVKKRAKYDELKEQPVWIQVVMWTLTIAAVVASIVYFTILR